MSCELLISGGRWVLWCEICRYVEIEMGMEMRGFWVE